MLRPAYDPSAPASSSVMDWSEMPQSRREQVAIPTVWLTGLLSLLFHAAMLWYLLPQLPDVSKKAVLPGDSNSVLVARLAPTPAPVTAARPAPPLPVATPLEVPPARQGSAPSAPPLRPRAPMPARPPPARLSRPAEVSPPALPPTAAPPPQRPAEADLASYVDARRRERGDAPGAAFAQTRTPAEIEDERRNRVIAANLASGQQQPTFGFDPRTTGGIFEVERMSDDDATFWFIGWDKDIGRRAKQRFEVRKGTNGDIRLAIVRKIISIIRDEVKEDFSWKSQPSGRVSQLSARPGDNAELEAFLMHEFFPETGGLR